MSQDQSTDISKVVANGIRLAGDTLIAPGSSQILDGKVGSGLGRFAIGIAARAVLGPIGWIAIGLDSYSKTTTGKGLLERMSRGNAAAGTAPAAAPPAPAPVTAKP